jgi:hypothetical protein
MGIEVNTDTEQSLRYLDGTAVECPGGKLEGLSLVSKDDEALGVINGVLIDPNTRQVRYYVIEPGRFFNRRRYLVSADMPAVVVPENRALRVELPSDLIERHRFDSRSVPRFSDDDLLAAMFAGRVA